MIRGVLHLIIKKIRYIYGVSWFKIRSYFRKHIVEHFDANLKKMNELKNVAERKRCFVVATGPSLRVEDLEKIENEVTFGVNSIFLMYNNTDWRPDYYVCTDAPYFSKILKEYRIKAEQLCRKDVFLNSKSRKVKKDLEETKNTHYISFSGWNRAYNFENYQFSDDIVKGLYAFGTVTNITIAIAMYMGYKEIYLLGADCSNLNRHFINDITDADKDVQLAEQIAQIQKKGYELMKVEAEKRNVEIFNSTRGGALEVFKRVSIEEVIGEDENSRYNSSKI